MLKIFKRLKNVEKQIEKQDSQYNTIQSRVSKVARTLTDEVEKTNMK